MPAPRKLDGSSRLVALGLGFALAASACSGGVDLAEGPSDTPPGVLAFQVEGSDTELSSPDGSPGSTAAQQGDRRPNEAPGTTADSGDTNEIDIPGSSTDPTQRPPRSSTSPSTASPTSGTTPDTNAPATTSPAAPSSTAPQETNPASPAANPTPTNPSTSTSKAPSTSTAAASATDPIDASDLFLVVDPRRPSSQQNWGQTVVRGTVYNSSVPNGGITGPAMSNGRTLRLGYVDDPTGLDRPVLHTAVDKNDPLYYDGSRAHLAHFNAGLPYQQTFWQTFSVRNSDWSGADGNQLTMQWHDGDHSSGLSPFLAWYYEGDDLGIAIRYSDATNPTRSQTTSKVVFSETNTNMTDWNDYVVEARIDPHSNGSGYLRIWRNGEQIVSYTGQLGYDQPNHVDYAVLGYYHWHAGNPFDTSVPVRETWWAWSSMVNDPGRQYNASDLQAHLSANSRPGQ